MFICGSGSFGHGDDNGSNTSSCLTPNRSKNNPSFCKIGKDNSSKNPYADRGLDKFNTLLAELEDKKQKIYTQMGSDQISMVRFVYSNDSQQFKTIVVKGKEKTQEKTRQRFVKHQRNICIVTNPAVATPVQEKIQNEISQSTTHEIVPDQEEKIMGMIKNNKRCKICKGSFKLENLRHPYYHFPAILVFILMFVVVYGKSLAILCTSIGWYFIPYTINGGNSRATWSPRKPKKKKEFVRKLSKKNIENNEGSSSPTSVINGLNADKLAQKQIGYRRRF